MPKEKEQTAPGIQFAQVLTDSAGKAMLAEGGLKLTLARACEAALDSVLAGDQNEGLKPKLQRGRLIEEIGTAAKDCKPLVFASDDITLLKTRIGAMPSWPASLVRKVCFLLDPATKE
jgi:hypothetical protein